MADIDIKIRIEAAKAQAQLQQLTASIEKSRLSVEKASIQNDILKARLTNIGKTAEESSQKFSRLKNSVDSFVGNLGAIAVSKGFQLLKDTISAGVENAVEYEKALIGVSRTANLSAASQQQLAKEIDKMAKTIPLSSTELLKFSQIAGQLGVSGVDQITSFTETFAKLSVATNISGEESAIAFTKILGLTGELGDNGAENIKKLGSVITTLGNNAKALETDIVSVGLEVAKGLAPFKLSSEQVLALATTLTESGVAAEAAGSSVQLFFTEMAKSAKEGGKSLDLFASAAGLTNEEFKTLVETKPEQAFFRLAENLNKANLPAADLIQIFENLGIKQIRTQRSLLPLITNYGQLEKNIKLVNEESKTRQSLDNEAEKAFKTLGSDLKRLSTAYENVTRVIISGLQPAISSVLTLVTSFFNLIRESTVLQSLIVGLGVAGLAFAAVATKAILASGAFSAVTVAASAAWTAITGPIGLVIAGIAALSAAVFFLVQKWDSMVNTVRGWLGLSQEIEKTGKNTDKTFKDLADAANKNADATKAMNEENKKTVELNNQLTMSSDQRKAQLKSETEALKLKAEEEKKIRETEQQVREAFKLQQDAEFIDSLDKLTQFNQGKLAQVAMYFTEEEKIYAEARLLNIENERLKQAELDRLFTQGAERRLKAKIDNDKKMLKLDEVANKIIKEDNKELARDREKVNDLTLTKTGQFFGAMAALARTGGEKFFKIQQALSLAQVIVNGIQQVSEAAKLPYPANIPAVAFAVADAAARTASIAAQKPSFEQGGIVPGTSFTGDNVQANVNSGEMILNRQQQSQLFSLANGAGTNGGTQEFVIHTRVELDGEQVGYSVSRQVANGLRLGEVV